MAAGSASPSGTVTFLFTDVEGSTALWEAFPAEMKLAMARHDEIVRSVLAEHGGHVFSTAGDSFSAAFSRAHDAVDAAIDLQSRLRGEQWPGPVIRARVGIHAGEVDERDGDYFGPPLNRGARLMAAGSGGQVLCSALVAELAATEPSGVVEWVDLGEVRLRDLLEPLHVFQASRTGSDVQFPPVRGLDPLRNRLPVQASSLIGRARELVKVQDLVGAHRLVTLTGVGGCGKTRLALAAAAEMAGDFADGVVFVDLVPVTSEHRLAPAVISAGGFRVMSGTDEQSAALARFLAGRRMLVVFDNCEHLLDGVAEFVEEMWASPGPVKVLATSREALGVDGEHVFRVPSLGVDEAGGVGDDATALLVDRVRAANARFAPTDDEKAMARRLCEQLDGLPLAIELAAAQIARTSLADVYKRLDRRFELLAGGRRRRRQRHHTLESVMRWSWELLDQDEQALLALLTVFAGSWSLSAAEAVCDPFIRGPVAHVMGNLVAKSLVDPIQVNGRARYRMLETVRLFAQHQLIERSDSKAVQESHRDHYLAWSEARTVDAQMGSLAWATDYQQDIDNFVAAIEWSIDRGDNEQAAQLVAAGSCLWRWGPDATSAHGWAETLLERDLSDTTRTRLLIAALDAGINLEVPGHPSAAHLHVPKLARAAESVTDPAVLAMATFWSGALDMVPNPDAAIRHLRTANEIASTPYVSGWVAAWLAVAQALPVLGERDEVQAPVVGPPDNGACDVIIQLHLLNDALGGRAEEARTHLNALTDAERRNFSAERLRTASTMWDVMIEALAGDLNIARLKLARARPHLLQFSETLMQAELTLAMAAVRIREGDDTTALQYLQRLKTAPMFWPPFFEVRRRLDRQACDNLDSPESIIAARELGQSLDIATILDRESNSTRSAHSGDDLGS